MPQPSLGAVRHPAQAPGGRAAGHQGSAAAGAAVRNCLLRCERCGQVNQPGQDRVLAGAERHQGHDCGLRHIQVGRWGKGVEEVQVGKSVGKSITWLRSRIDWGRMASRSRLQPATHCGVQLKCDNWGYLCGAGSTLGQEGRTVRVWKLPQGPLYIRYIPVLDLRSHCMPYCMLQRLRAGAVEQLKTHCARLKVPLYERGYEKDPAKVRGSKQEE